MKRIFLLPLLGALGACENPHVPDLETPAGAEALFDGVWSDFDRNYALFGFGRVNWAEMRAVYRDSVLAASHERERARLLGAMIGRLDDYHADLATPYGTFGPEPIAHSHHFAPDLVRRNYFREPIRSTRSSRIQFARLHGDAGYVYIGSFQGSGWGAEVEEVLEAMHDIRALVVDIRDNGGGNEQNGRDFAARLYDRTRTYRLARFREGPNHADLGAPVASDLSPAGARRFAGPVALITNRYNGSAAEDFVLMLRILPNVTVVGDTTLGLGSNPLLRQLPNGWSYRVPRSVQSTPDGLVYQWRGLPPTLPVVWSPADTAAGRDPYLEAALQRVAAAPPR